MKKLGIFLLATVITWVIGFVLKFIAYKFMVEDTTTLGTLAHIDIICYGIAFGIVTFFLTNGFSFKSFGDNTSWGIVIGFLGCFFAWRSSDQDMSQSSLILNIGLFIGMLVTVWFYDKE